ncbi:MAG: hypothetical protein ACKPKO_36240 [Candidatus Fonsibacter sp.]
MGMFFRENKRRKSKKIKETLKCFKRDVFDDSGYDTIVFDEILFCSVRNLVRIKRYCDSNPDKIVVATGDTNQLECIDCITNQHDYDEYYNKCVDLILPWACSSGRTSD